MAKSGRLRGGENVGQTCERPESTLLAMAMSVAAGGYWLDNLRLRGRPALQGRSFGPGDPNYDPAISSCSTTRFEHRSPLARD